MYLLKLGNFGNFSLQNFFAAVYICVLSSQFLDPIVREKRGNKPSKKPFLSVSGHDSTCYVEYEVPASLFGSPTATLHELFEGSVIDQLGRGQDQRLIISVRFVVLVSKKGMV